MPPVELGDLLRSLRAEPGLTQEEVAQATGLSSRAISDLERGVARRPQKDTVRLLADALRLTGRPRAEFEAAARGRAAPQPADALSAGPPAVTAGSALPVTRALPSDVASFTGRGRELAELTDAVGATAGSPAGIHAVSGMAGVGKTAFAVHVAHRLAGRFPDGQVFLSLHGHTPGRRPTSPADALATLLLLIGVQAGQIPPGLEARAGLWRDRLSGRKLLLVLDDAADSEHIRPLLPGSGDTVVLVTSRRRLTALENARPISLDTLPPADAAALLIRLAGRPGLAPDDPAVAELARLCGFLPLALGMVASQLRHHPAWSAEGRADELAAAVGRLELLATENRSVAAAFDLSYADLAPGSQRLFRRLGLHPGPEVDCYAAAALDDAGLETARRGLEELYEQHLLVEQTAGRYRLHDLVREQAQALASRLDGDDERDQAVRRLFGYYQHTALRADALLARLVRPSPPPLPGPAPAAAPDLASGDRALAWARAERANLLACLDHAHATGRHADVAGLTAGLSGLLEHDGPWTESVGRHATAVQACRHLADERALAAALTRLGEMRRLTGDHPGAARDLEAALRAYHAAGDQRGQAGALTSLGIVWVLTGDSPAAVKALDEALGIYRALDDQRGQAYTLTYLGRMRLTAGDYPAAAQDLQEALSLHDSAGDRLGRAGALTSRGRLRQLTGHHQAAIADLDEALGLHRSLGYQLGQVHALTDLGDARRAAADYDGAARDLREAVDLARRVGSPGDEARALAGLGRCDAAAGDTAGARTCLRAALAILSRLGAPEAAEIAAELESLPPG